MQGTGTAAAAVALVCLVSFFNKRKKDKCPRVGLLESVKLFAGSTAPWDLLNLAKKHDSDIYYLRLPTRIGGVYIVGDPIVAREVLLDKTSDKRASLPIIAIFGCPSMLTRPTTDPMWKVARKGTAPAFGSSEIKRMDQICNGNVERWIAERLGPSIEKNESFDPSTEMTRLTFNLITNWAFEYIATDEEYDHFSHHFELALNELALKQGTNPLRKYYAPSELQKALQSCAEVQEIAKKILATYRKNENKSPNKTMIRLIVENEQFDDKQRVAEIATMIIAGFETTGCTLSSILMLLAQHPDVGTKLRQELATMDAANWSKSDYLRCVITESKRFLPVAALGSTRIIGRDISCKGGSIVIPKGSHVLMPQILAHRNPAVFEDSDFFLPVTWENADKAMRDSLFTFSRSNRNCVGQSLAMSELYSVVPTLLARYHFEIVDEGELVNILSFKYVGARLKVSRASK